MSFPRQLVTLCLSEMRQLQNIWSEKPECSVHESNLTMDVTCYSPFIDGLRRQLQGKCPPTGRELGSAAGHALCAETGLPWVRLICRTVVNGLTDGEASEIKKMGKLVTVCLGQSKVDRRGAEEKHQVRRPLYVNSHQWEFIGKEALTNGGYEMLRWASF